MKHVFKLQTGNHPLWHLFVCANCREEVRIGKPGMRRLLKGERIDLEDFLPPCSAPVPVIKLSRAARERRMKGYVIGD